MIINTNSLEIFKQNEYRETDIGLVSNNAYLSIVATNNCQRNCFYCINSHTDRRLNLPIGKAVKNIKKLVDKYGIKEAVILGGEPLLHKDIVSLCRQVKEAGIKKLFLTTNGIELVNNPKLIRDLSRYLTGINMSCHVLGPETLDKMKVIYDTFHEKNVKVRINTNVWRENHDCLEGLLDFIHTLTEACVCDEIRVSNLIFKDSFSVNNINDPRAERLILTDEEYQNLFLDYLAYESRRHTVFVNENTLGFVKYFLVPTPVPVIVNWNIGSKVSDQVCENDIKHRKINTFKCLVSGDISLSWNTNNIIQL